jgi:hypothetical protein
MVDEESNVASWRYILRRILLLTLPGPSKSSFSLTLLYTPSTELVPKGMVTIEFSVVTSFHVAKFLRAEGYEM